MLVGSVDNMAHYNIPHGRVLPEGSVVPQTGGAFTELRLTQPILEHPSPDRLLNEFFRTYSCRFG